MDMTSRDARIVAITMELLTFKHYNHASLIQIERLGDGGDVSMVLAIAGKVGLNVVQANAEEIARISLPTDHPDRGYVTVPWYSQWIDGKVDAILLDVQEDDETVRDALSEAIYDDENMLVINMIDQAPADHWPSIRNE